MTEAEYPASPYFRINRTVEEKLDADEVKTRQQFGGERSRSFCPAIIDSSRLNGEQTMIRIFFFAYSVVA
jgi:hypothetical protein